MENPKKLIIDNLKNFLDSKKVDVEFDVSLSSDPSHGDFASNVGLIASKKLGIDPRDLASDINLFLRESDEINEMFQIIEVAGPGFINFYLSRNYLQNLIQEITQKGNMFGKSSKKSGQKVVVEYSSPNIAKPFTVGHLRSTIIGQAIANLLDATGWEVVRDNHLGDWGTQFGKQIYALKVWGNEEQIENSVNPVKELVALYVKFHEEVEKDPAIEDEARAWFKKLEEGDDEARRIYQKCVDWSRKEFDRLYQMLNVSFDTEYGESFFEDKMTVVVDELREKGLLTKENGAELVFFENDKLPPLMILKSDGATLYATRDLATDKFRLNQYGNDVVIVNEVGAEQSLYFKQLFEIEKTLGWVNENQRIHIGHGLYRFKDQKMSTRKGNTIWLEDVLEEAKKRAHQLSSESHDVKWDKESVETNSKNETPTLKMSEMINNDEKIGIGAIKWNDLRRGYIQDIVFDWDDILNMQGNSGPYILYSYVRTRSVINKANERHSGKPTTPESEIPKQVRDDKLEKEEEELLRFLAQYPYVLENAAKDFAPNLLCNYLFELSQKFNLFYQKHKIIGSENEEFRLKLVESVGQVFKNGLKILNIETVEKM